ncbi:MULTISPECIES: glutamine synthetase family protein [unclassified Bradyrhizobium]|uniref:glutamine synthetase family protein n=1 Tax=unclassified Bradyrhizobium TaxID=2631580 RepID=UPI001FF8DB3D|nr:MULTISPECIES: glutamine synthetase family protein [unclassified Bradyrhizobium]MCK1297382.1 glutamine synthetase [Bradyrhizobium sp. 37]MCK1769088.1 glutamine synthetase [Bradyrhizobium sp. 134]
MIAEEMVVACCTDLAGKVRGKAFPASQFDKRMKRGIGWTPTNVQITCFDTIAESPFGSLGDLVLIPDEAARVRVQLGDDVPTEHFALGDIRHTDGRPWEFCTRSILRNALDRLNNVSGLTLFGAFEHEFQFRNVSTPMGEAYSVNGFRLERRLAETLVAAMRAAGLEPDTFMKEFGAGQYEVTMGPSRGIAIADQSTILRELIRLVAHASGKEVTFTPICDPAGVGNGVHIHLSFLDGGKPATWDPNGKHELGKTAGQFIAGILKYLDAIVAITAPSVVSYLRLTPHRWSAAFNNLGFRDREASVRICPVSDLSDISKAAQFNFEFRAADATASPHLQLAALVHAGVQGIEEELPTPDATAEDLSLLDPSTLAARGHVRLPKSLSEALDRFLANRTVTGWFPAGFADTYAKHKKGEMAFLEGKPQQDICNLYEQVY